MVAMEHGQATTKKRKRPEERRRDVADAILRIVAQRGVAQVSAVEIAREVGVTDGALFHHFRDMEQMMLAAVERAGDLLFAPIPRDEGDPWARLASFFQQRISAIEKNPGVGRLVLSDVLEQIAPPAGVAQVVAYKRRSVAFIRSCLSAAQKQGRLAQGIGVAEATVLVLGALMALTQAHALVVPGNDDGTGAEKIWRILERTLRRPTGQKTTRRKA